MGVIIGIDLGTTNSAVSYLKKNKPEVIINKEGMRITPSVVGIYDGEIKIGEMAKRALTQHPYNTVQEIKRLMGTEQKVTLDGKEFTPQEISARILSYLKECAEEFLGEEVSEAVITVPAKFNQLQRQATKDAGEIAGLRVERIINEPTAAALAYGLENMDAEEHVLVYDLGGGTFDVSILELFEGVLDTKASRGNDQLGGKDFDERLMELIYHDFHKNHGIDLRNQEDISIYYKIKKAAEEAKKELSFSQTTNISIPFIYIDKNGNPMDLNCKISRESFESSIKDLVNLTEDVIDEALKAAGLTEEDINVVLAVGGSTRVPCVKKLLNNRFGNKVKQEINPDEIVAMGAAVQAGIKAGELDEAEGILITDTCPYTLGIDIVTYAGDGRPLYGVYDPIIEIDTKIPVTRSKVYYTMHDNQNEVDIAVYQGEELFAKDNILIGQFTLQEVPEAPAGQESIEVKFSYDLNGILKVDAQIISIVKQAGIVIDTKSMSREEIEAAKDAMQKDWKNSKLVSRVEGIIESAERKMDGLKKEDKEQIQELLAKLKDALVKEDEELVDKYDEELTDKLFDLVS